MGRAKIEAALLSLFAITMLVAAACPYWIELVFGVDPDGGSGALEWTIAAGCGILAILAVMTARLRWVKFRHAQ
ncbi:hypothetical protein EV589_3495 [Mycobacterium sp. BK558]|nr:hypothetical protein EV589_3495 [Mycobacterium sp. BK558]